MSTISSYRPHNPGHDYYAPGTYLITLVVTARQPILSTLATHPGSPSITYTSLGAIVQEEWEKTTSIQATKGRHIRLYNQVCMPDHWHGIIQVLEPMDISLGAIINAFKSVCTSRWRKEITGYVQPPCTANMIRHASHERRQTFYATQPLHARPLFDDNYDDTICLDESHLRRMIHYVLDNPRRAILRRLHPQFMERRLHIVIGGTHYAAFGNLFLLRWPRRLQVFCHRKARLSQLSLEERLQHGYTSLRMLPDTETTHTTSIPYEQTQAFQDECTTLTQRILGGATVLVTPGISRGEQHIKNLCLEHGYPLIHLQKGTIGPYWKPEQSRFDACARGSLLILAPWSLDEMPSVSGIPSTTDYSRFHNLNTLAKELCEYDGEARIVRG